MHELNSSGLCRIRRNAPLLAEAITLTPTCLLTGLRLPPIVVCPDSDAVPSLLYTLSHRHLPPSRCLITEAKFRLRRAFLIAGHGELKRFRRHQENAEKLANQ